jgi:hypothetical protein
MHGCMGAFCSRACHSEAEVQLLFSEVKKAQSHLQPTPLACCSKFNMVKSQITSLETMPILRGKRVQRGISRVLERGP